LAQREKNIIALDFANLRDKVEQNRDVIKQDGLYELTGKDRIKVIEAREAQVKAAQHAKYL